MTGKGYYSQCNHFGMQVSPTATGNQGTKAFKAMHTAKLQQEEASNSMKALDEKFYTYREELERVD